MFWAPLIVLLGTWCTGSSSQSVVTQLPSVSVSPGNTVKLSCTMSSGTSISDYYVSCLTLTSLLIIYESSSRPSGVSDRFSGASSGNTATLTITGVQAQDEADYYCQVWHSSSSQPHSDPARWGSETQTS
uniref:Ig-like domain-containing protein n=1 Tax=Gopherus agassizii TaxID=38772 RepID=A0A452GPM7_9SAUR